MGYTIGSLGGTGDVNSSPLTINGGTGNVVNTNNAVYPTSTRIPAYTNLSGNYKNILNNYAAIADGSFALPVATSNQGNGYGLLDTTSMFKGSYSPTQTTAFNPSLQNLTTAFSSNPVNRDVPSITRAATKIIGNQSSPISVTRHAADVGEQAKANVIDATLDKDHIIDPSKLDPDSGGFFKDWKASDFLSAIGLGLNAYNSYQAQKLAKKQQELAEEQLQANKDQFNETYNNIIKQYNTALADRLRARAAFETGDSTAYNDEITANSMRRGETGNSSAGYLNYSRSSAADNPYKRYASSSSSGSNNNKETE